MSASELLSLARAWELLLEGVAPLGTETLAVEAAAGRYLAEPLFARRQQPFADLSAMDGFAVRADDRTGPWRVVGESAAGHPFGGQIVPGEAIRISTGALMPSGEVEVLLQENASREGDTLVRNGQGEPTARHIRRAGFDFRAQGQVLPAQIRVGAAQTALALSSGNATLAVHKLPSVAVIDSGDELSADPEHCGPHQIPASNGAMIAAMAGPLARHVRRLGPARDTHADLAAALAESEGTDVVVTSGGASVGDHDLIRPALEAWGAKVRFWRVAIKPGKPLLIAARGRQRVIGLPGNPVSSYVTAYLFLLPLLRALAGAAPEQCLPSAIEIPLGQPLPPSGDRREFLRGVLAGGTVTPIAEQDSSALVSLARANVLIDRLPHSPPARAGDSVPVYPLGFA